MRFKLLVFLPLLVFRPTAEYAIAVKDSGMISNDGIGVTSRNISTGRLNSIDSLIKSSDIVVVDFWFTGCASCRKSIPELEEIYAEFSAKKVKFYGVTPYDDDTKINNFKGKFPVKYPLLQISSEVTTKYYISEYPTLMIFQKGKPALTIEGYSALFKSQVKTKLDALVK